MGKQRKRMKEREQISLGKLWSDVYFHILCEQLSGVMIAPKADIFIDASIEANAVILFLLNPMITVKHSSVLTIFFSANGSAFTKKKMQLISLPVPPD